MLESSRYNMHDVILSHVHADGESGQHWRDFLGDPDQDLAGFDDEVVEEHPEEPEAVADGDDEDAAAEAGACPSPPTPHPSCLPSPI